MSESVPTDPKPENAGSHSEAGHSRHHTSPENHGHHPDPITGEPDAHPVGVGVGALSAGAAGAAVGAFLGPVGMLVGAAVGAVVGGLAGHEVAVAEEKDPAVLDDELPTAADDRYNEPGFAEETIAEADRPLPTASSGLITPDTESIFADSSTAHSVTGEAPLLTESGLDAARSMMSTPQPLDLTKSSALPPPQPTESPLGSADAAEVPAGSELGSTGVKAAPVEEVSPLGAMAAGANVGAVGAAAIAGDFIRPTAVLGGDSSYQHHVEAEGTIRTAAYYRYLDREEAGRPGTDVEDWVAAEKEVLHT